METVRSAWQRLSTPARVALLVLAWPVAVVAGVTYAARRWRRVAGHLHWRNYGTTHLLVAGAAASVYAGAVLPPLPRARIANDTAAFAFAACACGLTARWVKRRRQRQWRDTGGRMTDTNQPASAAPAAHRRTPLAERVDVNTANVEAVQAKLDAVEARVSGLVGGVLTVLNANGTPVPDTLAGEADTLQMPALRPNLYVVRDDQAAGA